MKLLLQLAACLLLVHAIHGVNDGRHLFLDSLQREHEQQLSPLDVASMSRFQSLRTGLDLSKKKKGDKDRWNAQRPKDLFEVLNHTCNVLTKHNIVHWIDYGTALGAYRDGKIIPWDADSDVGMLEVDHDKVKALKKEFDADGKFELAPVPFETGHGILMLRVRYKKPPSKDDIYTDLYHYREVGDMLAVQLYDSTGTQDVKRDLILPPSKCKLEGVEFNCPNKLKEYLQTRYTSLEVNHKWDSNKKQYVQTDSLGKRYAHRRDDKKKRPKPTPAPTATGTPKPTQPATKPPTNPPAATTAPAS